MKEIVDSVKPRYKYTNDIVAILLMLSLIGLQAYRTVELGQSLHYVYVLTVLAGATWLFGVELLKHYRGKSDGD